MSNKVEHVTGLSISWIMEQHRNKLLDLNPSYQRKSVWSSRDKKFFLDTIFRNYPCPLLFLSKETSIEGKTLYSVIDGKQRIETILDFADNNLALPNEFGNTALDGKKIETLKKSVPDMLAQFWNYSLPIAFVNVTGDNYNELTNIFDRLNRNVRKLTNQELRHAKHDGWFITMVENEVENDFWEEVQISTKARAKRMVDCQNISELLLIIIENQISGFNQDQLDNVYAKYDFDDSELSEIDYLNVDDIKSRFNKTRDFVASMRKEIIEKEVEDKFTSVYAKSFLDFYTLWSVIALNYKSVEKIGAESLATKYSEFMTQVKTVDMSGDDVKDMKVIKYFENCKGATTELPQRMARYEALREGILSGEEDI
ncbi:MAG TPA: DUF262 domain-containing protein [archaeon]|nr:DUF262 domain-containing protein [archaeon]